MAAVKELSIEERLRGLWDLQKNFSELDEINREKGELPLEISDLEDSIAGLKVRIEKTQTRIAGYKENIRDLGYKIEDQTSEIEKRKGQLQDIKNDREYNSLQNDIEIRELDIQLHQKNISKAEDQIQLQEASIADVTSEIEVKESELGEKKVALEKIIKANDAREKKVNKSIDKIKKTIDERLLTSFDKIRNAYKNGNAVVKIYNNACGGCFAKVPPQREVEVGLMKKIIACEHCGRILVDPDIDNPVVEEE